MSDLRRLRRRILEISHRAGEGHIPSAFSVLEIVHVIYDRILGQEDRFILSKGHACLALYAVLEAKGLIPTAMVDTFGMPGGLEGHPNRLQHPSIVATAGSLGHGLPIGLGIAMASSQRRIFVLCGDGEMNEGSCWEAIAVAGQRHLSNLTMIVDRNRSDERCLSLGRLGDKMFAFGWQVRHSQGHDCQELKDALSHPHTLPLAVIAETVKGYGCPTMEADSGAWHHRRPTEEEMPTLVASLR